ncbi:MAG: lipase [Deltaproteobacteria bacterium SG8_13]|nr:MAG: lipase [Deltaproteobacteria bacterium SG8_13]
MNHVVLLGDSIFDNASYVPGKPPVIEQLRRQLPSSWQATLLAIDGDVTRGVASQLTRLPEGTTHVVVSTGGNDALSYSHILQEPAHSVASVLERFAAIREDFRSDYRQMLQTVLRGRKQAAVCTIYDAVPGLDRMSVTALSLFNDIILNEAFDASIPVIDLRMVCDKPSDYSVISPIEPSAEGGAKIVNAIVNLLENHDFQTQRSVIYT